MCAARILKKRQYLKTIFEDDVYNHLYSSAAVGAVVASASKLLLLSDSFKKPSYCMKVLITRTIEYIRYDIFYSDSKQ